MSVNTSNYSEEQIKEFIETLIKVTKESERTSEAFGKLRSSNIELFKVFSELGKKTNNLAQDIESFVKAAGELGKEEGRWNALNVAAQGIINASKELEKSFEKSRNEYTLATARFASWSSSIREAMQDSSNNIVKFGVSTKEAAVAIESSFDLMDMSFSKARDSFVEITQDQLQNKETIMTNVTLLKEFGIGVEQSTKLIDTMYSSMLMTTDVTGDYSENLKIASERVAETTLELSNMGYTMSQAASIMQKGSDIALVFGTDALEQLAAQAKLTRIEFDSLVAVSSKFETFDSAAQHVGKLNALLGADYVGVTDMMFAEPAERVKMLSEAFDQAGLSAESLEGVSAAEKNYTLMTIQSTLGLKDRNEALKFLNKDEFERGIYLQKKQEDEIKQAEAQERLNDALLKTMPVMEQLLNSLKNIGSIMQPMLSLLNMVLEYLAMGMNEISSFFKDIEHEGVRALLSVVAAFTVVGISIKAYSVATTAAKNATGALGGKIGDLAKKLLDAKTPTDSLAPSMEKSGGAASNAAKNMIAFGIAVLLIGGGILAATFGISLMADSIAGLGDQAETFKVVLLGLGIVLLIFVAALVGVALAGSAAAGPMLALGGAVLMIGAGMLLASLGVAAIIAAFSLLGEIVTEVATILKDLVLGSLDKVIVLLSTLGSLSGAGLMSVGAGLVAVAGGLTAIMAVSSGSQIAGGVSSVVGGVLSTIGGALGGATSNPITLITALSNAVSTFDLEKLNSIKASFQSLVAALNTPVSLETIERLEKAAEIIGEAGAEPRTTAGYFGASSPISMTIPSSLEMKVTNVPVIIKLDNIGDLKGHIKEIVLQTVKEVNIKTQ